MIFKTDFCNAELQAMQPYVYLPGPYPFPGFAILYAKLLMQQCGWNIVFEKQR